MESCSVCRMNPKKFGGLQSAGRHADGCSVPSFLNESSLFQLFQN